MKPFLKWAGGKSQLSSIIIDLIHSLYEDEAFTYHEPFLGGGSIFFKLKPKKAYLNDYNSELINAYQVVVNNTKRLQKKLDQFIKMFEKNQHEFYYALRAWDRTDAYNKKNNVDKAARMIFLNKTCYNGLYRVNLKGQFNTPIGKSRTISIYDESNFSDISNYVNNNDIVFLNGDYANALAHVKENDLVYVDPPYDYEDSGFTKYQKEGFTFENFKQLKHALDQCIQRGANVIISNNATQRVIDLFNNDENYTIMYQINKYQTRRSINSNGAKRKNGEEVIILGKQIFPQSNDVNKLINLIRIEEANSLLDKKKLIDFLEVTTPRQVDYYLNALKYLKLIDNNRAFTRRAVEMRKSSLIVCKHLLVKTIYEDALFEDIDELTKSKNRMLTDYEIKQIIKKHYPNYSDSTITRRASTVISWLNWCINI